jgi:hypothetical protein
MRNDPHSSRFASLAFGAFYCAVPLSTFYEVINSGFTKRRHVAFPKGDISKKIPPTLRCGLSSEALTSKIRPHALSEIDVARRE